MDTQAFLLHLDALYQASDLPCAEQYLKQKTADCQESDDKAGLLLCMNELTGLYRETGRAEIGSDLADRSLKLVEEMNLEGTIQHGTVLLNAATVNRVAGYPEKALLFYQEAEQIFLHNDQAHSFFMASLYNNMSQLYQDLEDYEKALATQEKALKLIQSLSDSASEIATSRVNISYTYLSLGRIEDASTSLALAMEYYQSRDGQHDPHYGSALSALGQLAYRKGCYQEAAEWFEKALDAESGIFGENDACKIIRSNLMQVRTRIAQIESSKDQ